MRQYRFDYGSGQLCLELDPQRVVAELAPSPVAAVDDVESRARTAIDHPVDAPALAELLAGKSSALILTVDYTRPSPAPLLSPILDLCEAAGVRPTVCIATGRHRQMTPDELQQHLTPDVLRRAKIIQHDPFDDAAFVNLGVTKLGTPILVSRVVFEHDVIIGVGIIEPSYLAGFAGGRKLIMPGIAHHTSIDSNHFYITDPETRIGRLDGNPVSDDCEEFVRKVPYHFICYAVLGPGDETVEVIAGDPFEAHRRACELSAGIYRVSRGRGDIIISSAGGYPYDCDLVQGKKAIVPACELVNEGGVIVILAECREGLGAEGSFLQWLREMTPSQVVENVKKREMFTLGVHGAHLLARPIAEKKATVILVTCQDVCDQLADTYVTAVPSIDRAWQMASRAGADRGDIVILHKARRLIVG